MPTFLDPFGHFPHLASAIAGLTSGTRDGSGPAGYVFHTAYVPLAPGRRTLTVELDGLRASGGEIAFDLFAFADDGRPADLIESSSTSLSRLAATGPHRIAVSARRGFAYALQARVAQGVDASAEALRVSVDAVETGRTALAAARRSVFSRPSTVGRRGWFSRSPVERAGLVVRAPAGLRDPLSQMCTAAQFDEPEFDRWIGALGLHKAHHRKLWEFAYVLQVLQTRGLLRPGARGLGFGVGEERLPSLLASMGVEVTATDLPPGDPDARAWVGTGQHSASLDQLHIPELCDKADFDRRVSFRPVDMNAIPDDLQDFDFCWSACAFEHLGSIEAGLQFFKRSVQCLRPGGVAVHTTELNLSSDERTLTQGLVVLFRRSDIERLALELHQEGHEVTPITYDQGDREIDRHIDLPPYANDPHLKLLLQSYVSTSFGLAVRRAGGAGR